MPVENTPQLITSVADFDGRLKTNAPLRRSVAGVSSISLSHCLRGFGKQGYSVPVFSEYDGGSVFCELSPDVYRQVFSKEPIAHQSLQKILRLNRDYGVIGAIIDYVMSQPYAPKSYTHSLQPDTTHLIEWYTERLINTDREEVNRQVDRINDELLSEVFPHKHDLVNALIALRTRKGVQTVYGNKPYFIEFLKAHNAEARDDCAAAIHIEIPAHLVLAVIPLGEYEAQRLLRNQTNEPK